MLRRAATAGLSAADLNYPDHFLDSSVIDLKQTLKEIGMVLNVAAKRYYTNAGFKLGAFTNPDSAVRRLAIDETKKGLDAKLRVQMRAEIRELHQRLKSTTVYVTHDQMEAMTMADKITVMQNGNIEQVGDPLDVYDRPANTFVTGFVEPFRTNICVRDCQKEG